MSKQHVQWTGHEHNQWQPSSTTTARLAPAVYRVIPTPGGPALTAMEPKHDKIVICEDGISEHLEKGIECFWSKRDTYREFGMLHKRGYLLEGPPGTGKTMASTLLAERIVKHGAASIFHNYRLELHWLNSMLQTIRSIQPDLPLLVVMEDLNAVCEVNDVERVLALLDGDNQVDNVVYVATTNFLKELDSRITNRPSRFDEVVHVGAPTRAARLSYLKQIVPAAHADDGKLQEMAKESEGLMMAHLRELVVPIWHSANR
jgi:ATP-dependent 26S proteasome regulatory subunit